MFNQKSIDNYAVFEKFSDNCKSSELYQGKVKICTDKFENKYNKLESDINSSEGEIMFKFCNLDSDCNNMENKNKCLKSFKCTDNLDKYSLLSNVCVECLNDNDCEDNKTCYGHQCIKKKKLDEVCYYNDNCEEGICKHDKNNPLYKTACVGKCKIPDYSKNLTYKIGQCKNNCKLNSKNVWTCNDNDDNEKICLSNYDILLSCLNSNYQSNEKNICDNIEKDLTEEIISKLKNIIKNNIKDEIFKLIVNELNNNSVEISNDDLNELKNQFDSIDEDKLAVFFYNILDYYLTKDVTVIKNNINNLLKKIDEDELEDQIIKEILNEFKKINMRKCIFMIHIIYIWK